MNKRQREVIQHGLNSEEEVLEALKETYKKALEDVEKEIKLLTVDDAIQSKIYRKEYQEQLKQQISSVLDAMNSGQFKTIDEYVKACYTDSFIGTMYDIAGQGVPLIIPIDQNQLIRAVSLNSKLSKSLYESLGENVDDLKKTVTQEISRGIATASNWRDIARNISYNMMGDYSQTRGSMAYAYRIARTEGHRVQNEAALHAQKEAKKNGADVVKQWDATLDGATRPNHRLLDGQIRELDEMFSVPGMSADAPGCSGIAAEDVNCRCTLLQRARWALDEEELETLKERAEYYGLSEEKANTFEEYEKNYLKAVDKGADSGGVRSDAQKINDENALENSLKSDRIGANAGAGRNEVYYDSNNDYSIHIEGLDDKVNAELSRAAESVALLGSENRCEHMYLVDLSGETASYYETNNEKTSVGYSFWSFAKEHKDKQFAFIHNHNTGSSLSQTDLETPIRCENIPIQIAVTNDGVKYIAYRKKLAPKGYFSDIYFADELEEINAKARKGEITPAERMVQRETKIIELLEKEFYERIEVVDGRKH